MRNSFLLISIFFLLSGCIVVEPEYTMLAPGTYRGVMYLNGKFSNRVKPDQVASNFNLEDVAKSELPFNFDLKYQNDSTFYIVISNGEEKIEVKDVSYERLMTTARDSVTFRLPLYDSYFTAYYEAGIIEGFYVDPSRGEDYRIPFTAFHSKPYRFTDLRKKPAINLTGRWSTSFGIEDSTKTSSAIAEFKQDGNHLLGTFLTTTGDYRYLEGTIQNDRAYLSTFDGSHAYLFTAKLQPDSSLMGIFRSGNHYQTIWKATRNNNARLPDLSKEVKLTAQESINLSATNLKGETVDLTSFENKVKVISVFGTWCPNCKDEITFLDSLYQTIDKNKVAIIGLGFERKKEKEKAIKAITKFKNTLKVDFPLWYAGYANKRSIGEKLYFIDKFKSYPTTIILDQQNNVKYIHSGFAGPATSDYGNFTKQFAAELNSLLK